MPRLLASLLAVASGLIGTSVLADRGQTASPRRELVRRLRARERPAGLPTGHGSIQFPYDAGNGSVGLTSGYREIPTAIGTLGMANFNEYSSTGGVSRVMRVYGIVADGQLTYANARQRRAIEAEVGAVCAASPSARVTRIVVEKLPSGLVGPTRAKQGPADP